VSHQRAQPGATLTGAPNTVASPSIELPYLKINSKQVNKIKASSPF
jgi:hypothetical protein